MKKYSYQNFTDMVLPHSAQFSPDGKNVAYLVRIADNKTNSYLSKLYITNYKTGKVKKLTNSGSESSFTFTSPRTILFSSLRNESDKKLKEKGEQLTVFYEIALDGGEAEEAFRLELNGASASKVDRNTFLIRAVFDNSYPDLKGLTGKKRDEALAQWKEEQDYEVADEFPYRFDGMGYINKTRSRLYKYNRATGKLKAITDKLFSTGSTAFSADKSTLYYAGEMLITDTSNTSGIYAYDWKTGKTETLLDEGKYSVMSIAASDDAVYFVGRDFDPYKIAGAQLWKIDLATKKLTQIYVPEGDFGFGLVTDGINGAGSSFMVRDNKLYFLETKRFGTALYVLENDKPVRISNEELQIASYDICCGNIAAVGIEYNMPSELYAVEGDKFRAITDMNKKFNETYSMNKPEYLTFVNKDGIEIDGWVIKPYGYEPGKKYPGYLEVHGGPRASYGRELMLDLQWIASEGYFVFYANPRGSSARGDDFACITGKYGTWDYDDLMEFTDKVLEKYPDIDGDRLGVGGGSYGGFMSNWIIGHTDRFKAAVPQCSISSWFTMYGCSDIPKFCIAQIGDTPWGDFEGTWRASPLKYAPQVKTPTLFLQYGSDFRCPMQEAVQMYTALMMHGVETKLVIFHGYSHKMRSIGKPTSRNRRCKEILDWIDKYVKNAK